jgi:hypothetical protein
MTLIGGQDGIHASIERLRKLDPGGTKPNRTDDLATWGAYDKLERTLQILADDHDQADDDEEPLPPEEIHPTKFDTGVFVAGGAGSNMGDPTGNGDKGQDFNGRPWSPEQACDAMVRSGYQACLVQLYRDRGADYMSAGRARGMKVGLWDAWPSAERAELALSFGPDMYCAQAETGQGQACMEAISKANEISTVPLFIVTNMEPSRTIGEEFDNLMQDCQVCVQPEVYSCENQEWASNPRGFWDAMVNECLTRGYAREMIVPCLGVYWGWTVAQYQVQPGEVYYGYLAETMQHEELC